jgi:hypothetical protein
MSEIERNRNILRLVQMSLAYCWKVGDGWWRGRGAIYSRWIVRLFPSSSQFPHHPPLRLAEVSWPSTALSEIRSADDQYEHCRFGWREQGQGYFVCPNHFTRDVLMYRSYYHGPIRGRRMDEPRYEDD